MLSQSEKRAARRIPVELPVEYTVNGTEDLYFGQCLNISVGGIAFSTTEEVQPGQDLQLTVFTADDERFPPLRAKVSVLRQRIIAEGEYEIAGRIEAILS